MTSRKFIGEAIEVGFAEAPLFIKTPDCPDRFYWRGEWFAIVELLAQWHDFGRRGSMASNMRPEHARRAQRKGSWGVGRFYFRVRTQQGRVFDLYYDRSPRMQRQGQWFLFCELGD